MIWGIDYGSKLAGTTVIAAFENGEVSIHQSEKKKDADAFILSKFEELRPSLVFLDAPLSLPQVYRTGQGDEFFYRQCDKDLKCMSPMFLGGLTARAMKLKKHLESEAKVFETYPQKQAVAQGLDLSRYKKDKSYLAEVCQLLANRYELKLSETLPNWHQVDALLALVGALNYAKNKAKSTGIAEEGLIWW